MRKESRVKKAAALAVIGTSLALSACGSQKQEETQVPSSLDDGVLTVGLVVTNDRSCYSYVDSNGEEVYAGWEPEVFKLVDFYMEDADVEIKICKDRQELLSLLNTGGVDIAAAAFTRLDNYESSYLVSDDYGYGSLYLINPRNGYIDTLSAFQDEVIGVSTQVPVGDVGKLNGVENVVQFPYTDMAMLAADIESGVVSAGVCTESEMIRIVSTTDLQACEIRETPQGGLVFLAPLGQEYLMQWVNWGIDRHYYEMALGIDSTAEDYVAPEE